MEGLWPYLKDQGPAVVVIVVSLWFMLRDLKHGQAQIKADTKLINSRMDCIEKSQHACQLENAKEFATKKEIGELWKRSDNHESRISRMEGKA